MVKSLLLSSKDAPDRSRTACYDVEVDIVSSCHTLMRYYVGHTVMGYLEYDGHTLMRLMVVATLIIMYFLNRMTQ